MVVRSRLLLRTAVVALIAAVPAAGASAPALAGSRAGSSPSTYLYRLLRVAQAQPNYGAAIKPGSRALTIFGVGYPTDKLKALIEDAPAHGVTAHWRRCPYTQKALADEAARLIGEYRFINQVGPNRDAFALIVGTTNKRLLSSYDPEAFLHTHFAVKVFRQGPIGDAR